MLSRYRNQTVPVVPVAPESTGTREKAPRRAFPVVPVVPAENDKAHAEKALARVAAEHGINWEAARSQMIDGDAKAGMQQLHSDNGDGVEARGVATWLAILADRANAWRTRPVTCGACLHFEQDPINRYAGAGGCRAGAGLEGVGPALNPMAPRRCPRFEAALQ